MEIPGKLRSEEGNIPSAGSVISVDNCCLVAGNVGPPLKRPPDNNIERRNKIIKERAATSLWVFNQLTTAT